MLLVLIVWVYRFESAWVFYIWAPPNLPNAAAAVGQCGHCLLFSGWVCNFGLSARSDIVIVALFGSLGASDVCGTNAPDCLIGGSHLGSDCRAFAQGRLL